MSEATWDRLAGVKAFADSGIDRIPSIYVKPPEQQRSASSIAQQQQLELIDVSGLNDDADPSARALLLDKLRHASETDGFFQVINHGVDTELILEAMAVGEEFFSKPLDEKMKFYSEDIDAEFRYGTSFNPLKESTLDWSDHVLHRFKPGSKEHPWLQDPAAYRQVFEEYVGQASRLVEKLMAGLSEALGLDCSRLKQAFGDERNLALRLNYYSPCPQPELAIGLSRHSDIGGLTVLFQSSIGLQVNFQGEWKTIVPVPGALIINIGDQLEIFSNGRYKSVEHRAVVSADKARLSVGMFWEPASDVVVAPLAELLASGESPLYQPCSYGDYVVKHFSRELIGKDLVDSRKVSS